MVFLVCVGQSLNVSEVFVDLLSAKAWLLNWIGQCLGKPAIVRVALASKDEMRVAEVLVTHLKSKQNGGPGIFAPSGERYRMQRLQALLASRASASPACMQGLMGFINFRPTP